MLKKCVHHLRNVRRFIIVAGRWRGWFLGSQYIPQISAGTVQLPTESLENRQDPGLGIPQQRGILGHITEPIHFMEHVGAPSDRSWIFYLRTQYGTLTAVDLTTQKPTISPLVPFLPATLPKTFCNCRGILCIVCPHFTLLH